MPSASHGEGYVRVWERLDRMGLFLVVVVCGAGRVVSTRDAVAVPCPSSCKHHTKYISALCERTVGVTGEATTGSV